MTGLAQLEKKLETSLARLLNEFQLSAVKAEFEAEGASFRDIIRLRRWTAAKNISLHLKIGGVEALRDIKDALDLGVDGLIAPMVESPFGVKKFTQAVEDVFSGRAVFKSINVETRTAVECIDDILREAKGKIANITIGRTDLSLSYLESNINADSEFMFDLIEQLSRKIYAAGLAVTVGGSLTTDSIKCFKKYQGGWGGRVSSLETRKIVLPTEKMLNNTSAFKEALEFEKLYLRVKLETEQWLSRADRERLEKIKKRI